MGMYVKAAAGADKSEVMNYRDQLYEIVKPLISTISKEQPQAESHVQTKRPKAGATSLEPEEEPLDNNEPEEERKRLRLDRVEKRSKLNEPDVPVVVKGRNSDKAHSSVNGVYVPMPDTYGGRSVYRKTGHGAPHLLFYESRAHRWKIAEELTQKGFAFRTSSSKHPPVDAAAEAPWHFLEGAGSKASFVPDPQVQCFREGGWTHC